MREILLAVLSLGAVLWVLPDLLQAQPGIDAKERMLLWVVAVVLVGATVLRLGRLLKERRQSRGESVQKS